MSSLSLAARVRLEPVSAPMSVCLHHSSTVPISHREFLGRESRVGKKQKGLAVADALSCRYQIPAIPCHEAEKRELRRETEWYCFRLPCIPGIVHQH